MVMVPTSIGKPAPKGMLRQGPWDHTASTRATPTPQLGRCIRMRTSSFVPLDTPLATVGARAGAKGKEEEEEEEGGEGGCLEISSTRSSGLL